MRTILMQPRKTLEVTAATLALICAISQLAVAADSWLAIHQTNGHDWLYTLSETEEITYGANELYVKTAQRIDTYALSSIESIEFIPYTTTVGVDGPGGGPISVGPSHLFQNYPNPFSPGTQIGFDLPSAGRAEIRIYDARGRLVRTLVDEKRPAGRQSVIWDGRDEAGRELASGVYFYSLKAPRVGEYRRMILVK